MKKNKLTTLIVILVILLIAVVALILWKRWEYRTSADFYDSLRSAVNAGGILL